MEPDASNTSLDLMRSNSDDYCQSSDEGETHNRNNVDDNSVRIEPARTRPHMSHTHSWCDADSSYTVTCTVSMVLAVPRGSGDDPVMTAEKERQLKKVQPNCIIEAPKAQAYYHIEYNLRPDDSKPIKVDLVMFGSVAKVYMDNETKVVKTWQEDDHLWLGWSQYVKLTVTRELLMKMKSHKVTFRLWDTKERVSPKAKFDRPKAFRVPQGRRVEDPDQRSASLDCELESAGGIKGMVYKLRALYEKQKPKTTTSKKWQKDVISTDYKRPSKLMCDTDDPKTHTMEASGVSEKQNPKTTDPKGIKSEAIADREKDMALSNSAQKRSLDHCSKRSKDTTTSASTKNGTLNNNSLVASKKKHAHKTVQARTAEEDMRKNGVASAELKAIYLLAGETSLIDRLIIRNGRVFKGLCSITLDQPLISEELKAELNPLIITILSASSLPSTPVPFYELEQKCMPVYCQYKFHDMPAHRTKGLSHGSNLYFKDVNVIFTGLLNTEELLEFLRGPPLEIEVHDRDRKAEEPPYNPAIFGTEATDDKLASTALVSTKQTIYGLSREMKKICDPYGIAKLNFSDLRGHRCLKLSLPIRGSHTVDMLGTDKNEWGGNEPETAGALDAMDNAMPNGHYLKANSELKVQIEIAHPLNPDKTEGHCPFGRIIYIFKYNNNAFLEKLRSEILRINALAFQVHCFNKETTERILRDHVMDATERENKTLNALTGFHFLDKSIQLFVLEGLKDEGIKKLWETLPTRLVEDVEKHVTVLYNSGLSFSRRLYDTLDVGLSPVHLYKPLETIMRQPLMYIRDTVPYNCLQAMLRINHLFQVSTFEEVVQNNLFLSAEMLHSLKDEFGIIPSRGVERLLPDSSEADVIVHPHVSQRRMYTPIDNFNKNYLAWKQNQSQANQGFYTKNFIQANIEDIHTARSASQTLKQTMFVAKLDDGQSAHNYSIQTMNCTRLAEELLRKEMAKEPTRRYTYSQDYHSFTVAPVDVEAEHKASEARSRAAWRTYDGFISPNFKDSMESHQHPKHPDEARVEELKKPWKENILHENILVLNRTTWPWSKRHEDFELYRKPPAVFSPIPPITIHLAGETLHREQLQAAHAQYFRWLRKILPDEASTSCGRVPEFKCYMQRAGLDKLHDILKDKPMKLSLRAWRGSLPIPYTDTQKEEKSEHCSSDKQTNASQHSKSQFGHYWRPHSFQHKRPALPLTDEEERLHVFQKPQNTTKIYTDWPKTQHKRNVIETMTHDSVAVHMK
ncbi:hypothetical protein AMELA_G00008640 [Ameiurus melas]|uniref:DUF4550 domain-containing protein n=1 Tax=Ameiurus melas TaxID=219545 RepID=A0A7J6BIV9_AMEME|nr:hypothetical protein AMELA_G00008640 [Ameiurus melas]